MSTIIGADAAKLAGLQIDALTKLRGGQLTLEHLERFLNLSPEAREERFGERKLVAASATPVEKFTLLADLGVITVPADYVHKKRLGDFRKVHDGEFYSGEFYSYNDAITDKNFPNPSRVLKSGDKLSVRVFRQVVGGTTTSKKRLEFLKSQNAVFTGAQGASLVYEQKRDQLPKGYWHSSLDEENRLWKDVNGDRRVPLVNAHSGGDFGFDLGFFESFWLGNVTLLCFCDVAEA